MERDCHGDTGVARNDDALLVCCLDVWASRHDCKKVTNCSPFEEPLSRGAALERSRFSAPVWRGRARALLIVDIGLRALIKD